MVAAGLVPLRPAVSRPKDSLRVQYTKRLEALKNERNSWLEHWRELSNYILPRRGRFFSTGNDRNKGSKRNENIVNNTATRAARVLASGMMAGITSPARPWFRLSTVDPKLSETGEVRAWLHEVEEKMREVFARSNIYNCLAMMYGDLGVFGTSPLIVDEDDETVVRGYVLPIGSYVLTTDAKGRVDGGMRELSMTVSQLVEQFQYESCSQHVKEAYDIGNLDEWVDVVHVIAPNKQRDPQRADYKGKRWKSCWFEKNTGEDPDRLLRESGYEENPLIAPRWNVTAEDVYGHGPGMDALGDIKALQLIEKRKAQLVDKTSAPPMVGPSTLAAKRISLLPGDTTFVDTIQGGQQFQPAIVIPPAAIPNTQALARDHEQRINETFLVDVWLMLANSDRRQITAREVDERHEEKMLQLGPTLERLHDELLNPLIDRVFGVLLRKGMLPPPPDEIQGMEISVDFISVAAQAQKLLGTAGIERLVSFVGGLAAASPEVLDKVNLDEVVDEYADLLGTKPDLIRSDEEVEEIRAAKAQAAQQAMAQQQMQTVAQGAKTLSETDTSGDNALTNLLGGLGAGAPGVS